jgi:hypothetical protein
MKAYRAVRVLYVYMSRGLGEWPLPAATQWESGGASEPVRTFRKRETCLTSPTEGTTESSGVRPVAKSLYGLRRRNCLFDIMRQEKK